MRQGPPPVKGERTEAAEAAEPRGLLEPRRARSPVGIQTGCGLGFPGPACVAHGFAEALALAPRLAAPLFGRGSRRSRCVSVGFRGARFGGARPVRSLPSSEDAAPLSGRSVPPLGALRPPSRGAPSPTVPHPRVPGSPTAGLVKQGWTGWPTFPLR